MTVLYAFTTGDCSHSPLHPTIIIITIIITMIMIIMITMIMKKYDAFQLMMS